MIAWWLALLLFWPLAGICFMAGAWWGTVQAGEKQTDAMYAARFERNTAVEDAADLAITGDDW